jgi:diguanylate cyclase (GGDEF)-like protein
MPFSLLLLILIGIILVADIAIVASAARRDPGRRRSGVEGLVRSVRLLAGSAVTRAGRSIRSLVGLLRRPEPAAQREDARTAAAIEAFVADIDRSAAGGVQRRGRVNVGGTMADPPAPDQPHPEATAWSAWQGPAPEGPARSRSDPGSAASSTWEGFLRDESARVRRFRRPATIVFVDSPGLDGVAERLGAVAADRIAAEIDRLLRAEIRETDRVVRLGPARFGVLMVETPAVDARRYVERVREATGQWFISAGLSPRLAIGWASPAEGEDLGVAAASAHERMLAADPLGSTVADADRIDGRETAAEGAPTLRARTGSPGRRTLTDPPRSSQ